MKGVKSVTLFDPQTKKALVELDPREATVQQLAHAVANTEGLHGKPYQAGLLLHVENLNDPATQKKVTETLSKIKGVSSSMVVNDKEGTLEVQFARLEEADGKGVRLGQILRPLREAGVTARAFVATPVGAPKEGAAAQPSS